MLIDSIQSKTNSNPTENKVEAVETNSSKNVMRIIAELVAEANLIFAQLKNNDMANRTHAENKFTKASNDSANLSGKEGKSRIKIETVRVFVQMAAFAVINKNDRDILTYCATHLGDGLGGLVQNTYDETKRKFDAEASTNNTALQQAPVDVSALQAALGRALEEASNQRKMHH